MLARALSAATLLLFPGLTMASPDSLLLESFERSGSIATLHTHSAQVARVHEHSTEGSYALEIAFAPGGSVSLRPSAPDWRPFGAVSLSVTNTSTEPAAFSLEVEDAQGARTRGSTNLTLLAGESARFALPLGTAGPLTMGMRGEPNLPGFRLLKCDYKPIALDRVAALRIAIEKDSAGRKLAIDEVRLVPGVRYDAIVDRFGQYTRQDWPGKLKDERELAARRTEEEAELAAHATLADRDEYGGWQSGPRFEATGYFRATKQDGKWWLVTPGGRLFFSLGWNEVDYRGIGTVVEGRESMFTWLPKPDDALAEHYDPPSGEAPLGLDIKLFRGRGYNFYSANLERKYGAEWVERWRQSTLARMRAWGFNTIGNWSNTTLHAPHKVPYTALIDLAGEVAELSSGDDYWRRMYDPFDPRFAEVVERSIAAGTKQTREDPWCLGYFVDNELPWGNTGSARGRYGLALGALALGPGAPAKRAIVEQLRARYGGIGGLNRAWGAAFAGWDDLLAKPYTPAGEPPEGMREDLGRFVTALATRYFETIRDALRRHDPNHMYLGNRFAWHTPEAVRAGARFCDVVSFNIYAARVEPERWRLFDEFDRPILVGEFHMGAVDRGMFHTGLVAARDQAERARMYRDYVRSVADNPKLVGCHFFKYVDEPLTGRPGDGENYNIGFVTVTDTPYPEMVEAAKAVHAEVYRRRAGVR
jgi:hypothetical protein